jgi:hypothetical protein
MSCKCSEQVLDFLYNRVQVSSIEAVAILSLASNSELAGFSVSANCRCLDSNTVPGLGPDYGRSCLPHDSVGRDCQSLWPSCTAGPWCCKSW